MSVSIPAVLAVVAALGLLLAASPTPQVAGKLMQLGAASGAVAALAARRRVSPVAPYVLSGIGGALGLVVGVALSGLAGWPGGLIGAGIGLLGVVGPQRMFRAGWQTAFVQQVYADLLLVTRHVYLVSGVGRMPIDEGLRLFARSWAGRSALADALAGCPATASPVTYLGELGLPGAELASLVVTLGQASTLSEDARAAVLKSRLEMMWAQVKHQRVTLVKKRAQTVLVISVVVLLLTLMLAVLAPPMIELSQTLKL